MIKIKTSNNYIQEKKYIINTLLYEFLGLEYKIEISDLNNINYELVLPNNKKLIIKDAFWANIKDSYLKKEYIPKSIKYLKNEFTPEVDVPVIYGSDKLTITENHIYCGIDFFASSFFMLTRWEEYVNKTRDQHNRFPAMASLAYKFDFLDRPIVNEYVETIWNMLKHLGFNDIRKSHKFEMLLTHDVDAPFRYTNLKRCIGELCGDIIKRKNLSLAIKNLNIMTKSYLNPKLDPFYTFSFLMNQSEKIGLKSHFFFMGGGTSNYDGKYNLKSRKIQKLIKEIQNRNHIIGFHPSYYAYNDKEQWKKEKETIEKAFDTKIICGREHVLRFEAPFTWQIWENNEMEWDSTLSYADKEGFRCGTCWEYPVFNFLTRKELKLKEKPLIVMEVSLFNYQKEICNDEYFYNIVRKLIEKCKKYNGTFAYLWHNSNFYPKSREELYKKTLSLLLI